MKPLAQNSMIQNRYLVVQMIGKGGMGEVYLAVDQRLGSAVALKRTMFKENDGLASAFEREAKILGRLRHPVLPKVIDHFVEGNDQYLVMEHITGEDLGKRIEAAGKPFPMSWVMFWSDQLLDALTYLHSHEPPIIHRDIKPENLKLTDDNHIVLLDFGLSKDFDTRSDTSSLGTGSVVGYSPYFASMEQVRGTGTDARSDLYSFSATIYQLLTNTMPADSLTRADAMLGGEPDPVQSISNINSEVPPAVSDVILKGLSVRQDARFESAAEMQRAMRRAFNSPESQSSSAPSEASTRMMTVPTEIMTGKLDTNPTGEASHHSDKTIPADAEANTRIITDIPGIVHDGSPIETENDPSFDETAIMPAALVSDMPAVAPHFEQRVEEVAAPEPVIERHVSATRISDVNGDTSPAEFISQPTTAVTAKKSRRGVVVGGLLGLLLLVAIAAGGGWVAYNKYYLASQVPATPLPTAEVPPATPIPTPSPTLAEAPSPEANTQVTENDARPSERDTVPPPEGRPSSPTAKAPPRTTQVPASKPTPKPKGPGDRTVILQ